MVFIYVIKTYRTELKDKAGKRPSRVACMLWLCQEALGEGKGTGCFLQPLPSAGRGKPDKLKWKDNLKCCGKSVKDSVLKVIWHNFLWCLDFSLSSVSTAVRAQDEDGADASNGRTDTSSSVSISNSISSCEVSKIVRTLQVPLACLWPSLLMWFRAFATRY